MQTAWLDRLSRVQEHLMQVPPSVILRAADRARSKLWILRQLWQERAGRVLVATLIPPHRLRWMQLRQWSDGRMVGTPWPAGAPGDLWLREDEIVDWVLIYADGRNQGEFLFKGMKLRRR